MAHTLAVRNGMTSSDEADLSNIPVAFISSGGGVVGANDYAVYANNHVPGPDSPNTTVQVNVGRAYVPTVSGIMVYSSYLDTATSGGGNVSIASNTSGSGKTDSIVLYVDLAVSPDSTASNVAKFASVRGASGAPTNSEILTAIGASNPYIILANIAVANNFTSISSGNITDVRAFASFTTGQVVPVPQYEDFTDQSSVPSAPSAGKTRMFSKGSGLFAIVNGGTRAQVGSTTLVVNGNSGTTPTNDWSQGNTQTWTLNNNATFTFSNPTSGMHLTLILTQDSTGSRLVTWPVSVKWSNGVAPTLSTVNGKIDLVGFIWNGTNYLGFTSLTY